VWLYLLVNGIALGLGAAAPIGPVNVEIARRVMRHGRRAGFLLGCGAVTIDVAYAIVTSVTMLPVMRYPRLMNGLSIAGGIFLAYLGWLCLHSAWRGHEVVEANAPNGPVGARLIQGGPGGPGVYLRRAEWGVEHYVTGLLMTALNPPTLLFWFVAVPGAVGRLAAGRPTVGLPIVCGGVFLGAFAWVCFFTGLVGHLKKFGAQRWVRWIDFCGGVMLLAFAARAIWRVTASSL
jgi:L-lysine exporter family protein LysE/ArgO